MSVLFVLPAETIYDRQHRVMGWKATPSPRESLKQLKGIIPRLRELGAAAVVYSDFDVDSGYLLAKRLGVPFEEWMCLRRLNVGKHHGASASQFAKLEQEMSRIWTEKPDIPIKGGDSLTSFKKRVSALGDKLESLQTTTLVVADERIIKALTGATGPLERGRVYEWRSH